jgi:hydroxyacylglutathione hydrolase
MIMSSMIVRALTILALGFVSLLLSSCGPETAPEPSSPVRSEAPSVLPAAELGAWLAADPQRVLVDLRAPEDFAKGYVTGAINLQSGWSQFEIRAQRFFGSGRELALCAADPKEAEQIARAHAGSFVTLRWLDVPAAELEQHGLPWTQQLVVDARTSHAWLEKSEALFLDARTAVEYSEGHPIASMLLYPDDFPRQIGFFRKDRRYVVFCEGGWRSSLLVSYMRKHGFSDVHNLMGGMAEWRDAELPIETGSQQRFY